MNDTIMNQLAFKEAGKCIDILVFLLLPSFFLAGKIRNANIEARNKYKIPILNDQNSAGNSLLCFVFWSLQFVSDFVLRI